MRKSNHLKKTAAGVLSFVLILVMAATAMAQGVPSEGAEPAAVSNKNEEIRIRLQPGTQQAPTVAEFLAEQAPNAGAWASVVDSAGREMQTADRIHTGCGYKLTDAAWSSHIAPIVVAGDVTGSGQMSIAQLGALSDHLAGKASLSGLQLSAADLNADGRVDADDLESMRSMRVSMTAEPETRGSAEGMRIQSSVHSVRTGDTVDLTLLSPGSGAEARISTQGLRYLGMKGPGTSQHAIVLTQGEPVTYSYMVTAATGEEVSFSLTDTQVATGAPFPAAASQSRWSRTVATQSYGVPEPKISVSGDVLQGSTLTIRVTNSDEFTTADITTAGLAFRSLQGSGDRKALRLLGSAGAESVYTYEVLAAPGQTVGFWLKNIRVSLVEGEDAVPAKDTSWTAKVDTEPQTIPNDAYPVIQGPKTVHPGDEISIVITSGSGAYGTEADLSTTGLLFQGVSEGLSSEDALVLVPSAMQATYTYRVASGASSISVRLSDVWVCLEPDNVADTHLSDVTWSVSVGSDPAPIPTDRPQPSPDRPDSSSHFIGLPAGGDFEFTSLRDGTAVLKGMPALRQPISAQAYLRELQAPAGGSLRLLSDTGRELNAGDAVYTGCRIEAVDGSGKILESAAVAVRGDLLGTGTINISQLTYLAGCAIYAENPTELQVVAGDQNANGKIDITDLVVEAILLLGEYGG